MEELSEWERLHADTRWILCSVKEDLESERFHCIAQHPIPMKLRLALTTAIFRYQVHVDASIALRIAYGCLDLIRSCRYNCDHCHDRFDNEPVMQNVPSLRATGKYKALYQEIQDGAKGFIFGCSDCLQETDIERALIMEDYVMACRVFHAFMRLAISARNAAMPPFIEVIANNFTLVDFKGGSLVVDLPY